MLLTDKYADKIHGIITCYDRMIIQGYIPNWSHAEAMTAYMKLNGIRIFDYPTSFSPAPYGTGPSECGKDCSRKWNGN